MAHTKRRVSKTQAAGKEGKAGRVKSKERTGSLFGDQQRGEGRGKLVGRDLRRGHGEGLGVTGGEQDMKGKLVG